jgi:hypothetical protein
MMHLYRYIQEPRTKSFTTYSHNCPVLNLVDSIVEKSIFVWSLVGSVDRCRTECQNNGDVSSHDELLVDMQDATGVD